MNLRKINTNPKSAFDPKHEEIAATKMGLLKSLIFSLLAFMAVIVVYWLLIDGKFKI